MKSIFTAAALMTVSVAYSQSVSAYKTISIVSGEGKSEKNIVNYELYKDLAKSLKAKGYQVVTEKISQSDSGFCDAAFATITDTSTFLKNKVRVDVKDCQGKNLYSAEGRSDEKEYEVGYPDALAKAVQNFPMADPNAKTAVYQTLREEKHEQIQPAPVRNSEKNIDRKAISNREEGNRKISKYSYGTQDFNRVNLSSSQFILVSGNSSTPFATFKESGRNGIYHVILDNGSHGLGYFDGSKLIVEIPNGDGSLKKMELNGN